MSNQGAGVEERNVGTQWTHRKQIGALPAVCLAPTFLSLEYGAGNYTTFPDFFREFSTIFNEFIGSFGIGHVDRIGLRYVNEIRLPGNALDWDGIVSSDLVTSVKASIQPDARLLRSMHQVQQVKGDNQIMLTYGIVNLDFPSPVVQRHFVLDIDCTRQGLITAAEALTCVQSLNDNATDVFESCIENNLRQTLGVVE